MYNFNYGTHLTHDVITNHNHVLLINCMTGPITPYPVIPTQTV